MNHMLYNPPWSIPDETHFSIAFNFHFEMFKICPDLTVMRTGRLNLENFEIGIEIIRIVTFIPIFGQSMIWFGLERRTERPIENRNQTP